MVSRRQALRLLGVTSLGATAGCSAELDPRGPNERPPERLGTTWSPPDTEWRSPRGDPRNTASVVPSADDPTPAWRRPDRSGGDATPESGGVVGATEAFVITATEYDDRVVLRRLDARGGTRRWRRAVPLAGGRRHPRFAGIVDGQLLLTDAATDVIAVRTTDGAVRWRVDLLERVAGSVPGRYLGDARRVPERFAPVGLATADLVYVQTSYGLHGVSPADGTERWRLSLGDGTADRRSPGTPSGMALTDRQVWASYSLPGAVYAVDVRRGEVKTTRTALPEDNPWRPVVAGDGAVALTTQVVWSTDAAGGLVTGINGRSGPDWQFSGVASDGAAAFSAMATDGRRLFVCEAHATREEFVVFGLRAATGGIEWIRRDALDTTRFAVGAGGDFGLCGPAVAGQTVVVGYGTSHANPGRGRLVGISARDGRVRWQTKVPVAPENVVAAGDRLYVGGRRGDVLALDVGG